MYSILEKIVKLLHLPIPETKLKTLYQFVKFGIVGLSNTFISYGVYVVCVFLGMNYFVANAIGFVVSVLNSFYWNNKYVFTCAEGEKRALLPALLKTFISYGSTGLVLNSVLLYLFVNIFHINEYVAPLINLIITIPLNFILNKLWAFNTKSENTKGKTNEEN